MTINTITQSIKEMSLLDSIKSSYSKLGKRIKKIYRKSLATVKKSSYAKVSKSISKSIRKGIKSLKPYFKDFWIFAYIVVVLVGAQVTLADKALAGVYVNALAFILLVGLALWQKRARMLAISAAILPVANMINLALPQSTRYAQTVVFYDSILALALVYRFIFVLDQPVKESKLGKWGYLTVLPLMAVIGQVLGVIGYVMLRHHYTFGTTSLPLVAACTVIFAVAEETYFRGLIQQRGSMLFNPVLAAILSLILFTFTTIGHVTILAPVFALILGIVLVTTYFNKNNLILTMTINAVTKLVYVGLMAAFIFR
ncbi:MAG TPA: CPBP family glutamic-type intramembrane protease [Patescibacteria group bacterium]|jgi:membrane protease YdiL (CAAX protease family)|nr:CPBP family glutamic-type intramembrane protease [Patescibacteria group bacterium]